MDYFGYLNRQYLLTRFNLSPIDATHWQLLLTTKHQMQLFIFCIGVFFSIFFIKGVDIDLIFLYNKTVETNWFIKLSDYNQLS